MELMAEGRSNLGVARLLFICESTVERHVRGVLVKLGLSDSVLDHRRVLAVLALLQYRADLELSPADLVGEPS